MATEFGVIFATLKAVLQRRAKSLDVQADSAEVYSLVGRVPSPFPQHKSNPMWFGSVRMGKTYVSFHLMPLYMNPPLEKQIPPELKKRMQGKSCFNFKTAPAPEMLSQLDTLIANALDDWTAKGWL